MIYEKIFKMNKENIQSRLSKVPNDELIDLYVFVKYCYEAITHSEHIHVSKNKIHEQVLEDYLFDRPELEREYGPKKSEMKTLDEKVQFERDQEEKSHKKTLKAIEKKQKTMGCFPESAVNLNDKTEFPDLMGNSKKTETVDVSNQNLKEVIQTAKTKPATYQKSINEMFPTLGEVEAKQELGSKNALVVAKTEKSWWEKINDPKPDNLIEATEVVKIRKGKGKNQRFVAMKGVFDH
jgi:hypothetical protein